MIEVWLPIAIVAFLAAVIFLVAYFCYRQAFFSDRKRVIDGFSMPPGKEYQKYYPLMKKWYDQTRAIPHEDVYITSFDGLKLHAKYYEYAPGATVEIMFHGYKGNADSDLCGGIKRCFEIGRSILLVDQRASGRSEGKVISFGINERMDCQSWANYAAQRFGSAVNLILTGISMGAATVIMASELPMPKSVIGVIADCSYSSPEEIIKKTISEMRLPPKLAFPFVKLGAKIFGRFNLMQASPIKAVKNSKLPIIFFHGSADDFVPCCMSERLYAECVSPKRLVIVEGAGHGLSFPVDMKEYLFQLKDFETQTAKI